MPLDATEPNYKTKPHLQVHGHVSAKSEPQENLQGP